MRGWSAPIRQDAPVKQRAPLLLAILLAAGCASRPPSPASEAPGLRTGPMRGYAELTEARIWVQTTAPSEVRLRYWPHGREPAARLSEPPPFRAAVSVRRALNPGDLCGHGFPFPVQERVCIGISTRAGGSIAASEQTGRVHEGDASEDSNANVLERVARNIGALRRIAQERLPVEDGSIRVDAHEIVGEVVPVPAHISLHEGVDILLVEPQKSLLGGAIGV